MTKEKFKDYLRQRGDKAFRSLKRELKAKLRRFVKREEVQGVEWVDESRDNGVRVEMFAWFESGIMAEYVKNRLEQWLLGKKWIVSPIDIDFAKAQKSKIVVSLSWWCDPYGDAPRGGKI